MKNLKIITLLMIFSIVVSCLNEPTGRIDKIRTADKNNKNNERKEISSFEDYFKFLNQKTDGDVIVQSVSSINSGGEILSVTYNIKGSNDPLTLKIGDKILHFNRYEHFPSNNPDEELRGAYGNKFELNLTDKVSNKSKSFSSVYIPKIISVSFSNLTKEKKVVAGTTIKWNTDSFNKKGVVIGLEYDPFDQFDQSIVDNNPNRLLTGATVKDSGSYTITAKDLERYPSDASITFYVARAGYNIATDDSEKKDYSLSGMTVTTANFNIKK